MTWNQNQPATYPPLSLTPRWIVKIIIVLVYTTQVEYVNINSTLKSTLSVTISWKMIFGVLHARHENNIQLSPEGEVNSAG